MMNDYVRMHHSDSEVETIIIMITHLYSEKYNANWCGYTVVEEKALNYGKRDQVAITA